MHRDTVGQGGGRRGVCPEVVDEPSTPAPPRVLKMMCHAMFAFPATATKTTTVKNNESNATAEPQDYQVQVYGARASLHANANAPSSRRTITRVDIITYRAM